MPGGGAMNQDVSQTVEEQIAALGTLVDAVVEFAVAYGFQIFGALLALVIGLKIAAWAGNRVAGFAEAKNIDPTLSKFAGSMVRVILVGSVLIITLGNFGITIAPLIALAGASAFGATIAIQGPLSNYGAGLAIILSRPFVVGNTITVNNVSGVVEDITLAATVMVGEDGETIRVPNKEVVGRVIVNSFTQRVVQTKICIAYDADAARAIEVIRAALGELAEAGAEAPPQVGIHDFTYGGIVLGARFWVPSKKYFETRYAANGAILRALRSEGIKLLPARVTAMPVESLSADDDEPGFAAG